MKQVGFTLIELMIVVAIVGILAAIAIPQYQGYVARTQINRAFGELAHFKTQIEYHMSNGEFDFTEQDIGWVGSSLLSLDDPATPTAGDGIELTAWTVSADGYGYISAKLGADVSAIIEGIKIYIEREQDGAWFCFIEKANAAEWRASYLPAGCTLLADGGSPTDD